MALVLVPAPLTPPTPFVLPPSSPPHPSSFCFCLVLNPLVPCSHSPSVKVPLKSQSSLFFLPPSVSPPSLPHLRFSSHPPDVCRRGSSLCLLYVCTSCFQWSKVTVSRCRERILVASRVRPKQATVPVCSPETKIIKIKNARI